jgi:hypothetical protein
MQDMGAGYTVPLGGIQFVGDELLPYGDSETVRYFSTNGTNTLLYTSIDGAFVVEQEGTTTVDGANAATFSRYNPNLAYCGIGTGNVLQATAA